MLFPFTLKTINNTVLPLAFVGKNRRPQRRISRRNRTPVDYLVFLQKQEPQKSAEEQLELNTAQPTLCALTEPN